MKTIQYISNSCSNEYRFGFNGKEKDDEIKGSNNSLDFGARIYDSRTGRWLSLDPERDKYPSWSAYSFSLNNPIKYNDYGGKFVVDPALKEKYGKVALIIENAQLLYNNQELPSEVKKALEGVNVQKIFDENFRSAFEEFSTLNKQQIQDVIAANSGPMVTVENLDMPNGEGYTLVNGLNNVVRREDNSLTDINVTENGIKGKLSIDDDILDVLEFELGGDANLVGGNHSVDKEDKKSAFKSFISTLFHESVHYGRNETGAGNTNCGEKGEEFEIKAFEENVKRTTKSSLKDRYGNKPKTNN